MMNSLINLICIFYPLCCFTCANNAAPSSLNYLPPYLPSSRVIAFQNCGSIYDILLLSISGCNSAPCLLPLGDTVQVNAEFNDFGNNVNSLRHHVFWVLNAVNTKAYVTPDSCDGKSCPFRGYEGMAFSANLYVNSTLPAVSGTLYWEVFNQLEERVMCYKIPIAITY